MPLTKPQPPKSFGQVAKILTVALASSVLLAGCGGGGGSSGEAPATQRMFVAGDSLFDTGTFGIKFTVQNAAGPTKIIIDLLSDDKGLSSPCPAYSPTLTLSNLSCTGFAVGGAGINTSTGTPRNVVKQLQDMKSSYMRFESSDLVLIDGGGNDFAALTESFGAFATAAGAARASQTAESVAAYQAATQAYATFVAPLLQPAAWAQGPAAQTAVVSSLTTAILTADDPSTQAVSYGLAYSVKLADVLVAAIDENLIAAGATRIFVANPPNIVLTPQFSAVRGLLGPVVSGWIAGYNLQLESLASARSQVAVYNLYAKFSDLLVPEVGATFGFTNVVDAACASSISENPAACSTAALDASRPDWRGYFFSDGFHGTPLANEVIAQDVIRVLDNLGW
jgi:outer membrane lipase/esterase